MKDSKFGLIRSELGYLPDSIESLVGNSKLFTLFINAPASTKYHSNYEGGLLDHTFKVVEAALDFYPSFERLGLSKEDLLTACVWHDIGKIGLVNKHGELVAPYYIKTSAGWKYNKELNLSHQELSCNIYTASVDTISLDVYRAIRYHNMLYTDAKSTIGSESSLMLCLHWADMFAARFMEYEDNTLNP